MNDNKKNSPYYKEIEKYKEYDQFLKNDLTKEELEEKFKELLSSYKKLIREMNKLIKISDSQSNYLIKIKKELSKANEKLKELSITDNLTKLYNRTKYYEVITNEIERSRRYNTPFSAILADIDHFKNINDRYGHNVGDIVLINFSKILLNNVRKVDICIRWGGEEFLIILPEINAENAYKIAERLRSNVENYDKLDNLKFTASFGVAEYQNGLNEKEFINNVDKALYISKETGRNKVTLFKE